MTGEARQIAEAITNSFVSPNVFDTNGEAANIVDTTNQIAKAGFEIAKAINNLAQAIRDTKA